LTKEAAEAFFAPWEVVGGGRVSAVGLTTVSASMTTTTATAAMATTVVSNVTANDFHNGVTTMLQDSKFVESTKSNRVPLPMLAFAKLVVDRLLRQKDLNLQEYFDGLTMTVPSVQQSIVSPEYHSIVGQKLLYVNWMCMYGMEISCPHSVNTVHFKTTGRIFPRTKFCFLFMSLMDLLFGQS